MVGYLVYVTLDLYKKVKIDRENHQVGFFKKKSDGNQKWHVHQKHFSITAHICVIFLYISSCVGILCIEYMTIKILHVTMPF